MWPYATVLNLKRCGQATIQANCGQNWHSSWRAKVQIFFCLFAFAGSAAAATFVKSFYVLEKYLDFNT
jgi:hypothetical protein